MKKYQNIYKTNSFVFMSLILIITIILVLQGSGFWLLGLLILPAMIFYHSANFFKGSILLKILFSLLPWTILLLYLYVKNILATDPSVFIGTIMLMGMIIFSLLIGIGITIIKHTNKLKEDIL